MSGSHTSSFASLLLGRELAFARHPVVRELVRLLSLLGAGAVALAGGYVAQELATGAKERLLHEFHEPGIILTSSIYGAYAEARSPIGIAPRAERSPDRDAAFVTQMHVAYERILALGDQLLELYAAHRERRFDAGAVRLRRSLKQLRALHAIAATDEREFAEALAGSDLSVSIVVQQLERLHQGAARELAASIARTRDLARVAYAAVALSLLLLMAAFARRSMRAIWDSLEAERSAKEALLIKDQAMATPSRPSPSRTRPSASST